jgi:hypothetical protein
MRLSVTALALVAWAALGAGCVVGGARSEVRGVSAGSLPLPTDPGDLTGRWDLTVRTPQGHRPSWLEIRRSGREALVGVFVGVVGSARPVARVVASGDSMRFTIPRQWEDGTGDLTVEGRLEGNRLVGRMTFPDGKRYEWTAVRAPALRRASEPAWDRPIALISRNDLRGWRAVDGENQWTVENGVLRSPRSGANLMTERTFGDFKLHVEFRYPRGSNSGVYLRGRHEVQIEDNVGMAPTSERFGSVYGFIAPSEMAARAPGEWQSFDITLVGRMVTVVANGRTVICNREIAGITGGAIDSDEGAPGPILLQGDHGPIEYRNITIRLAR